MTMQVRTENCIGCEACLAYCPMNAISMVDGVAVIDQEKCVECGMCRRAGSTPGPFRTPCVRACPAGIDVPRYIRYIAKGKPEEALAVIRERIPFPAICGLVCFHPCEARCARGRVDEPVAIRSLKRYAYDETKRRRVARPSVTPTGRRVAVVGAGPAGLSAAYYLACKGHTVVVYEALDEPGGMLSWAIPEYRLPRDILRAELETVRDAGVAIKLNSPIRSVSALFDEGFHSVFVSVGAQRSLALGLPGEAKSGAIGCMDFLRAVKCGQVRSVGSKVAVVGGGNSALEAARIARRLGAKHVTVFYRRSLAEMPASREKYDDAVAEGVEFAFQQAPLALSRRQDGIALEHVRTVLGVPDDSGRPTPVPVRGSETVGMYDTVIVAIGQQPEVPAGFGLRLTDDGMIAVDPLDLSTSAPGVFAGGDAVLGPASVIQAIHHGRRAAIAIDQYLGGDGRIVKETDWRGEAVEIGEIQAGQPRVRSPQLPTAQRVGSFDQVELGLSRDQSVTEALRCLQCDLRPRECVGFEPPEWPRALRCHFSQPGVPRLSTGIAGRGTEEMKTNDVTGRFKRGMVGLGLDVGRPSLGAYFRDVQVLTMALARMGIEFEANNPITKMMLDVHTGQLPDEVLNEKVVSCVVEGVIPMDRLESVLTELKEVVKGLETVVSVCCINRANPDGTYELQSKLNELGIFYRKNGKQNAALGRPLASV